MKNFTYHNPVKIIFGKGSIARLKNLIAIGQKILLTYGGGSIKTNGVYDQVISALAKHSRVEFAGIEPNPRYKTLMKAVKIAQAEKINFILSVGGGSVLDGSKFIAAAMHYQGEDAWDIPASRARVARATPLGCVLTLPATGSEMNANAVISRDSTQEKLAFYSPLVYPQFSILDPQTTFSLSARQTANGVVDAFVHIMEQYLTYPAAATVQDRQAEAILLALLDIGPKVMAEPDNYDHRADLMWAATQALNGVIGCGVPGDWATHSIGHELTAFYGIDHAQSLAVVLPALLRQQNKQKWEKLLQYGERVWQIRDGSEETRVDLAIEKTELFFRSLGVGTRLQDYRIEADGLERIGRRIFERNGKVGERGDIGAEEIDAILRSALV
ncbi:iron-containing alcohol dehydrogenase [candidate division KSB1 bacterium]|nr:iron-containing alcohol dehydrogenase [candidate division KSB1 bacterium]